MSLVDTFDCDKKLGQLLLSQVHLAECAFAQDFTDSVEFDRCLRTVSGALERISYVMGQLLNDSFLRRNVAFNTFLSFYSVVFWRIFYALVYTV